MQIGYSSDVHVERNVFITANIAEHISVAAFLFGAVAIHDNDRTNYSSLHQRKVVRTVLPGCCFVPGVHDHRTD